MINDKNNAFGGEKQNKKSNSEQSDLCDLEQVTLKPQLQVHHYLTTWLQIWYYGEYPKGCRLRKAELLIRLPPREIGKIKFLIY